LSLNFDSPLKVNIKVSLWLAGILVGAHTGAAVLVINLPFAGALKVLVWGLLVASLIHFLRREGLRLGQQAVVTIALDEAGAAEVRLAGAEHWRAARITRRFVHPMAVFLVLRLDGARGSRGVAIFHDAVEREAFRRLRARLMFQTAAG